MPNPKTTPTSVRLAGEQLSERLRSVGEELARLRHEHDWTQTDAAERLGLSRDTIARLEAGRMGSLIALAAYVWLLRCELRLSVIAPEDMRKEELRSRDQGLARDLGF